MRLGGRAHAACEGAVRGIQAYHQRKGWSDIAYSWMFCNHGVIFECRGSQWNQFANGADLVGENNGGDRSWYTAMWLGGTGEEPSADAIQAAEDIVAAVRFVGAGSRVLPHLDFRVKTCPGPALTSLARRMDNQALTPPEAVYVPPVAAESKPEPLPVEAITNAVPEGEEMFFIQTSVPTLDGIGDYRIYQIYRDVPSGLLLKLHVPPAEWAVLRHGYIPRPVPWADVSVITDAPHI
jgi:hypothetical protein